MKPKQENMVIGKQCITRFPQFARHMTNTLDASVSVNKNN